MRAVKRHELERTGGFEGRANEWESTSSQNNEGWNASAPLSLFDAPGTLSHEAGLCRFPLMANTERSRARRGGGVPTARHLYLDAGTGFRLPGIRFREICCVY